MNSKRITTHYLIPPVLAAIAMWALLAPVQALARDIGIAFVEDPLEAGSPQLARLIVQELEPLLDDSDQLTAIFPAQGGNESQPLTQFQQALQNPSVDYIVATGFIGSQALYRQSRFTKPPYLTRVLDPQLTGGVVRDNVRNLRS
ncbi:MAG: hypothetical protein AAF404_16285, partial [Pseudomonadota bacterium]